MTWPGTHPDTEAGKPNTTDPAEQENHTPTKATTPTTGSPTRPPDDTTAGQNDPEVSIEPPTSAAIPAAEASTPQPESPTPDTDSPPSADHDTDSENSSNTPANTDQPASDASDANHKSATDEGLPDILETLILGPDDQLVIRLPQYTTMEQYARVRELIPAAFADRVLLVAGVEQLAVLRSQPRST